MEFDTTVTAVAFLVLFGVLAGGTLTSGMPTRVTAMISPVWRCSCSRRWYGVKHGQYRARSSR